MVTGCGVDGMGSNRAPDFTNPYHGAGIYANMWGILMGSMLPYTYIHIYSIHGSYGYCFLNQENV